MLKRLKIPENYNLLEVTNLQLVSYLQKPKLTYFLLLLLLSFYLMTL